MARPLSDEVRRRIVDAAGSSFYENGYAAMGVDALASTAGVSKMTLYRYFPSKEELICAVLDRADEWSAEQYERLMADHDDPADRLAAVFDWIAERAGEPDCRGCMFQNGAAEFPEIADAVHDTSIRHKRSVRECYLREARAMRVRAPDELADQLLLLTDGAWAAARMWGPDNPARSVASAARLLIEAHRQR
ncbi:MAG: TetR/AcrR family transcriptional regulator [Dermatophilaceae bacterium]